MWIRCPKCGKSTRTAFDIARGVNCVTCGFYTSLEKARRLGATPQERFKMALGFARVHRIDLASAYSVLMGIIPFSKALSIPGSFDYDPGFRDAVERGFLTPSEAYSRGDRPLYATTLALNHSLDMKTAFLIADNRMQLADALSGMVEPDSAELEERPETRTIWSTVRMAGALALGGVMVLTMCPGHQPPVTRTERSSQQPTSRDAVAPAAPESSSPATKPSSARFRVDDEGRVTEVSGPDPKIVLTELCAHQEFRHNLSPIALAPTVPPSAGTRLGLIRDMRDLSALKCVTIRRDSNGGRWLVGDGARPIEIQVAPPVSDDAFITRM